MDGMGGMDEQRVSGEATILSNWPTSQLDRAYRLAVMDVRDAVLRGAGPNIAASEEEAAMFAEELVRRGAL